MKPKAPPSSPDKKETVVSLIPHQGPQVNLMVESYHDAKLKRTKVCACASVLIALIIVAGVLGSIALWKIRFPYQDDNRYTYNHNLHKYPPPHNSDKYPYGHGPGISVVTPNQKEGAVEEDETEVPGILRATTEMPSSGNRDDTISIDDGPEKDRLDTVRLSTTLETLTVFNERTDSDDNDRTTEGGTSKNEQPSESSESFGSFDHSLNYEMTSYLGSSSSVSSGSDYVVYPSFDPEDKADNKLIPWTPDYESESSSSFDETLPPEGSGFGHPDSGSGDQEGSGFEDMEISGDLEGSGDYSSIDPDMYLPLPEVLFDTQQFSMLENDYSSSVTEISNVLKDPKQEYEFWKYIYDQSDVLVGYIEGAKQKLIRQEHSLNVVDPDLPSVQLVRTPGPEDKFKGKCYNLVCTMKSPAAENDGMKWALTGYAREGVRLVHASGNKGEVQITLRRQPISATSMLHYNSYLLLQFSDLCFISQIESGLSSLPNQRADFPIVETFQSTAQVYKSSSSEFCEGLPVYWARKVDGFHQMDTFGKGENATPGSSLARRKDIQMPCCYCEEEPCICSCDIL